MCRDIFKSHKIIKSPIWIAGLNPAKSPKKWNCLEEIRKEIKEKENVEKAIRIV